MMSGVHVIASGPCAGVSEFRNAAVLERVSADVAYSARRRINACFVELKCVWNILAAHLAAVCRVCTIIEFIKRRMRTHIPAYSAYAIFVFVGKCGIADRAFFASVLRPDSFQHVRKLQIADLARMILIPLAAEPVRMAALSRRAADSALTRIARIILMPLMLLVTLLAKSRMIPGPAMLMRPGEQS